jgi:hypothetical protein
MQALLCLVQLKQQHTIINELSYNQSFSNRIPANKIKNIMKLTKWNIKINNKK